MDQKIIELAIPAVSLETPGLFEKKLAQSLGCPRSEIPPFYILKRSLDARRGKNTFRYRLQIGGNNPFGDFQLNLKNVSNSEEIAIIGMGPAGIFSAIRLIELGYKPVIYERGKAVRPRRRDLANITKNGIVDSNSNYCFGEGGAGTFSDGKLYTRSKKRGNINRILEIFVQHGADKNILFESHPHIGTNKLPKIIENLRETILSCGGEVHFESSVTDIIVSNGNVSGLEINKNETHLFSKVILATGHSSRSIYQLFKKNGWLVEAKSLAIGLRVEHAQSLIDKIQYKCGSIRPTPLPAASYNLVKQVNGRGVHSFCMCPGGIICPAATSQEEVVVNGWSPSKRDSPFSNSGIVVQINPGEFDPKNPEDPFSALRYQETIEKAAFVAGGKNQNAPAQRLVDFTKGISSSTLPQSSYRPGLESVNLREFLPELIYESLKGGFQQFGKMMNGYFTNDAVVVGVESRTSSPLRIPRTPELEHPEIKGLFPCGEGAGYAGGIMSAALDGERIAESISLKKEKGA